MDKRALQSYAVWAKINLENQIEVQLKTLSINSERDIKTARVVGDRTIIDGDMNSYPADLKNKRDSIVRLIQEDGYKQVIEEFAYTWFNRIIALRFMEVHDFLPHGFRVLSSRTGSFEPEIMKNLNFVKDDLKLDLSVIAPLMEQGKIDEAYRYVLFRQCNALSGILPMLFSSEQSYLELLLPKALLKGETFITKLLEIGEDDFLNDVEVIGWLYQFYVADGREEKRKKANITKDDIPTLTQVFTPDWIVRYMAENSVGRIWLESYPNSALKNEMKYYVEDAEQEEEVQRKIDFIKYKSVNPEDIKIIEPCCGSGHILVYVFDLIYKMYEEKGYTAREIPTLILKKNLTGLEIDKRAAQLASFSLIMKARSVNSRFFNDNYYVVPEVYEIWDARGLFHSDYLNQIRETKLLNNQQIKDIEWLAETFRYGKTIGSLLMVERKNFDSIRLSIDKLENEAVINIFNSNLMTEGIKCLRHLLRQAEVMAAKYDVMITNPPYLGISKIDKTAKEYLVTNYPNSKSDMFAMFMEVPFINQCGFRAIVNPDSWMFLKSYEKMRLSNIDGQMIWCMAHIGAGAFDASVQTTSFILRNCLIQNYLTTFNRIVSFKIEGQEFDGADLFIRNTSDFSRIPSKPIAYWLSNNFIDTFKNETVEKYAISDGQTKTGDNDKYLRFVWEVSKTKTGTKDSKWVPHVKGGNFKKWYGNIDTFINWSSKARQHYREDHVARIAPEYIWFKKGISWNLISGGSKFAARYLSDEWTFNLAAPSIIVNDDRMNLYILGLLNTYVAEKTILTLNPTLNTNIGDIMAQPLIIADDELKDKIIDVVRENVELEKEDWDSYETSLEFSKLPFVIGKRIETALDSYRQSKNEIFVKLKKNEEFLNSTFIQLYNLQDELDSSVEDKYVTITSVYEDENLIPDNMSGNAYVVTYKDLVKQLLSYLIGVEMGRYSLDVEGLAYAGGDWNPMNYVTYQPDDDGIIPVYPQLGMADGLTARIIKLIKHIYGEDTYKENIDFIADALGKKNSESSEETLNRYLNEGFYADHLKTYQKRPIYWMFSSGKNDAFKCLVYLHRYNEDTLARINSKYFLNESARLNAEVNDTAAQLEAADGREKLRLDKLYKILSAKQKEMLEYGWVLDHMANQYIPLDLDDGVKVNYAKFQGIEIVNDNGAKVKKDLLVPIK